MAASRGTDAADIEPLEVRRAVERRGAHLAVDEAPPPTALTPGSTSFFAAPPIANTLIQWKIGSGHRPCVSAMHESDAYYEEILYRL